MSVANAVLRSSHRPIWHLIDARGQVVGRLAAQIAPVLTGKHKPTYSPNVACGDMVVVVNASEVVFTGNKLTDKVRNTS
jgi:large subunit ribosomal protein L13